MRGIAVVLPPLEAMVCGAPVITSNTSSLPGVVSDAGIQVDPQNGEQIAAALHRLMTDREENARRRVLSAAQATRFSSARTAPPSPSSRTKPRPRKTHALRRIRPQEAVVRNRSWSLQTGSFGTEGKLGYAFLQEVRAMTDQHLLERIVLQPDILAGKPVIKGTRLSVDYILGLLGHGATVEEIREEYHGLGKDDIAACFLFAAKSLQDTAFMPLSSRAA